MIELAENQIEVVHPLNLIEIEWLTDNYDCDHAGCSGGWAEGAIVKLNGEVIIECIPQASCFGSVHNWSNEEIYAKIFDYLGYVVKGE